MTEKEKLHQILSSLWKNDDSVGKMYYNQALQDAQIAIDSLQEEPVNRTPADIESAMQEVEEKSRVFTEAHQGEDTDTILAQMRGEEPLSEDLEEEISRCILDEDMNFDSCARHFANWQKEQFEKNRLAACDRQTKEEAEIERDFVTGIIENEHRQPTFDDAIKYGMRLQKEQMMKNAISLKVKETFGKGDEVVWVIRPSKILDKKFNVGEKVKVIVIKED